VVRKGAGPGHTRATFWLEGSKKKVVRGKETHGKKHLRENPHRPLAKAS